MTDPKTIIIDNLPLPFRVIPDTEELEFYDKDKWRSDDRGSRFVRVKVDNFIALLQSVIKSAIL